MMRSLLASRECLSGDRGSASLWSLGVGLVLAILAAVVAMAGGVAVARHRAQTAADFGALAGAINAVEGEGSACAEAGRLVTANGAQLVACHLDGLDVTVTASVLAPYGWGRARASARAGPIRAR